MRSVHELRHQTSKLVPFLNDIFQKDLQIAVQEQNVKRLSSLAERIVRRNRVFWEIPDRGVEKVEKRGNDFGIAIDQIRHGIVL